ncbi:uncharacterized protein LOC116307107 isoform X2 [Actinia tenebrosa]|uniref:Uncharacterized protein LOC116307107 isoform X2 n=1 Tax=Actinia tenebrosa TaxID=6105 RepID=A0A6P8IZZ3_ACTTE|nr:uncharacterized protein LOC116307107 isoform X2 [Actinia tenebrosa]
MNQSFLFLFAGIMDQKGYILILFFSAITSAGSSPLQCKGNQFALDYSGRTGYRERQLKTDKPLSALTACFWMKRSETDDAYVFVYTTAVDDKKKVYMVVDSEEVKFRVLDSSELRIEFKEEIAENTVISVCLTWDKDKRCNVYKNSVLQDFKLTPSNTPEIPPGGTFALGGKKDKIFKGFLSHFNMWSYVLPMETIALISHRCWAERGDVISWEDFKDGGPVSGVVHALEDICPERVPIWNHHNLLGHWPLDGPDQNISLNYSAAYLEGRYDRTRSLFLDSTKAHAVMPSYNLSGSFTIALWLKYTSFEDRNATILSNWKTSGHEFILKIIGNKITFRRARASSEEVFKAGGLVVPGKWFHLAIVWNNEVSSSRYEFQMFVDGKQQLKVDNDKQTWNQINSETWDIGGTTYEWKYGYYLGYISDLMVFNSTLSSQEIGQAMGIGIKQFSSDWKPRFPVAGNPLVGIQTRQEASPDGNNSCVNERMFVPGDCLGALLIYQNQNNPIHVNISVNDELIPVICDQSTNGGGWLIIGRKLNATFNIDRSNWYTMGFGQLDHDFWLGSKLIATITKQPVQLSIEIQDEYGQMRHAAYRYFKMNVNKGNEKSGRVAHYTGNAGDVLEAESSSNQILIEKIKNLFSNATFKRVEMKIRPNIDLPSDYDLYFQSSRPADNQVKVTNLTEISSFTICAWIRVRVPHVGTLFSLVSDGISCHLNFLIAGNTYYLAASCGANEAKKVFTGFDDQWHHVCASWKGSTNLVMLYLNGVRIAEKIESESGTQVIPRGAILNIGQNQTSRDDSSIQVAHNFIGQLGHLDMWDFHIQESEIIAYARGPSSQSGNVVPWAVVRTLASDGIRVIYPSSCLLKERYHWRFNNGNNSVQYDENANSTAVMQGSVVNADEESLVIERGGYIMASNMVPRNDSLTMSFWMKQEVLISDILGENAAYHTYLKDWLSPLVSYHASWLRCYSSKKDGWLLSTFHNNCDLKGPTITLIRVKDNVFGGIIDQSWGGTSGYLGSTNAFLFSLKNPHNIPALKFPMETDLLNSLNNARVTAAQTSPFLGPSFGLNDLVIYEDANSRVSGYSDLGNAYKVLNSTSSKIGTNNIFTGTRWFYPDEIEVFYYDLTLTTVSTTKQLSSSLTNTNGMWCSGSSNDIAGNVTTEMSNLDSITHIGVEGQPENHVTSFGVKYDTAADKRENERIELTTVFASRNQGRQTLHALMPPIRASNVSIYPISWKGKICMKIKYFTFNKACGAPLGMENGTIPDERISASSSFKTYKYDESPEPYRWPMRGRLNNNEAGKAWVQANDKTKEDWLQVDLGTRRNIRCVALQGLIKKIQYVKEYKISYSNDGSRWDFAQTDYNTKIFKGVTDSMLTLTSPTPRMVKTRFLRIHTTTCRETKTCALRLEIYENKTDYGESSGLRFFLRRGSNNVMYASPAKSWKIESQPKIVNWTHVAITWSSTYGLKVYYNGSLFNSDDTTHNLVQINQFGPVSIAIGMVEEDGLGNKPMKLSQLKVWQQELNERDILADFQSISCNFENGSCWGSTQDTRSPSSWERTSYCLSDNETGLCQDDSLTGYYLKLKASPVSFGQSSMFTSPLLHSTYSCVSFTFLLSGNKHVGRLNINLIDSQGNKRLLWRRGGNHGKMWMEANVPVKQAKPFKIEFEGIKGREYDSYIAIDNIKISIQTCETLTPQNANPNILAIKSSILDHCPTRMQSLKDVLVKQGLDSSSLTTCYTSREHGWSANAFHSRCDLKGPTLLLARSENNVFGGATEQSWGQSFPDSDAYSLQFTSGVPSNHVLLKVPHDMTAFSLSLWMKTPSQTQVAIASTENSEFALEYNSSHLIVQIFSSTTMVSHNLNDDIWHHIIVQWQNINGNCTIFIEGSLKISEKLGNSKNKTIPAGSSFALGKGFQSGIGFTGFLDHVNLWSSVIGEVGKLLSRGCLSYHGNTLAWPVFKDGIKGIVTVVPSRCQANKSASNYEMIFERTSNNGYVRLDSPWKINLEQFTISWWMKTESKENLYFFSHVNSACAVQVNHTLSIDYILDQSSQRWQFSFKFTKQCMEAIEKKFYTTTPINDGYWHHLAATWSSHDEFLRLYVDGRSEGSQLMADSENVPHLPPGGKIILAQKSNTLNGSLNALQVYEGKLSGFNMWDFVMDDEAISVLSLTCGAESGNLMQWTDLRHGVVGQIDVISPSSCPSGHYRPDNGAFIFALHADVYSSTVARIRREQAEVATRDDSSRGPVYGDAPHDLIVGVDGKMYTAIYNQNVSYDTQILANGSFSLNEVEVFYLKATMCSSTCPYKHSCDEINGGCICDTAGTSFGLCDIDKEYQSAVDYWPLDEPKAIKNLRKENWGTSKCNVTSSIGVNGGALKSNGLLESQIELGYYDTSCLSSVCTISIALWLKYWPSTISGRSQTFLDIHGLFTLFQPGNSSTQLGIKAFTSAGHVCNYVFNATTHIWSQIFIINSAQVIDIYRNGLLVTEFVQKHCWNTPTPAPAASGLITLNKGGALAEYDDLVIWNTSLSEMQIKDIFKSYTEKTLVPITFIVKLTQEVWHDDLLNAESELYHEVFRKIQTNITKFYSGLNVSTTLHSVWEGSVMSNFTVSYHPWSPDLVMSLQNNVSAFSSISDMPVQLFEVSGSQVPSRPASVQAVVSSTSTIDVGWMTPDMDDITQSIFQGYYVYLRQNGVARPNRTVVVAPKTTTTLRNLPAHTEFQIWVSGFTLKGEGMPSSILNLTIAPPRGPPQNFTARSNMPACIKLMWQPYPLKVENKPLQGYRIFYYATNRSYVLLNKTVDAKQNALVMCDLMMATNYTFRILGFNDLDGPSSDPIIVMTTTDVPVGKPVITDAYNTSTTSIVVKWDRIPSNLTRGIIVGYEVQIYRNDSRDKAVSTMMVDCENVTVKGLEKYTAYVITVAGTTKGGKGPYSDPVVCFTDEDEPEGSPSNITLVEATARSLNIKWLPIPKTKRFGIIIGHTAVYYSLDDGNKVVFNQTCVSCVTTMNISNLKPFRNYRVEIFGFNSKGNGPITNMSITFQTMQAAPSIGPIMKSAVNQSSTSVLIKWDPIPKQSVNGILQSYVISYHKADSLAFLNKTVLIDQATVPKRRRRRAIDYNTPQVLLDGLDKFTTYSIMAAGVTVAQGPFGLSINVTTDQDVPEAPSLLEAKNTSSTSIIVTWQEPSKPNGIIQGYIVYYSEADNSSGSAILRSKTVRAMTTTLTGLTNYTTYLIKVAAYTTKGVGAFNTTRCTTDEAVPTGPPQSVSAFAASTVSIEVRWQPVLDVQRRGVITHYIIEIKNSSGSLVGEHTIPGDQYTTIIGGLGKRSNYTVRINAYTRIGPGPFSEEVFATTGVAAPKVPPGNVTAELNGTTEILVKWSNLELHINGAVRGYRITYTETNHPFSTLKNVTVDNTKQDVLLTGLYYYTQYKIRVAGFTIRDGNFSDPVYVTTGEGVPGQHPSKIVVSNRGSREIGLFWDEVDAGYRNGKVIKYRVLYRKTVPAGEPYLSQESVGYSMILQNLERSTTYEMLLAAGTSVGYGNSSIHYLKTDEDVPSQAPINLTAHNWTSLYSLPVTWEPVPQQYMHGVLTNYYLSYFLVKEGDKDVLKKKVFEKILPASQTWFNITDLLPLSVYKIEVAASTKKGTGPISITFGETCRCKKKFSTNWKQYQPYSNVSKDGRPGHIIPIMIQNMASYCCETCKEHGQSEVDFHYDGHGQKAEKTSLQQLIREIDGETDFSFPVYGYHDQTTFKGGLGYTPLIESPGVAFIVGKDSYNFKEQMFEGVLSCWPVIALPLVMTCIAGFIVWLLEFTKSTSDFPKPFIKGFNDGIWWSFVSMTTVGYGDRIPKSFAGRSFAVCWTLTGIVIISVATSSLTTTLTEITVKSEKRLYGAKVAALQDGPEFLLGIRRNALVNEKNKYYTLDAVMEALNAREVRGILVDTYAAGSRPDLFNEPSLRVAKVLDYKMAYGLVTAGHAIKLRRCFLDFLNVNKADIYYSIVNNVRQVQNKKYDTSKTVSTGLFDPNADFFKKSVKYTLATLISLVVVGICYEFIRKLRLRARIDNEGKLYTLYMQNHGRAQKHRREAENEIVLGKYVNVTYLVLQPVDCSCMYFSYKLK